MSSSDIQAPTDILDLQVLSNKDRRTKVRQYRAALSAQEQSTAGKQCALNAVNIGRLIRANRVASYRPFQGEMPTEYIHSDIGFDFLAMPKITSYENSLMLFYPSCEPTNKNRYGIIEPTGNVPAVDLSTVDAVLVPLVCFDRQGGRMGMGAGFYDRALSFCQNKPIDQRPLLVGVAYAFQEVTQLSQQPWDVPMDVIITDQDLINISY